MVIKLLNLNIKFQFVFIYMFLYKILFIIIDLGQCLALNFESDYMIIAF